MQKQVISYPVPLFNNNIPINATFYQPSNFFISAITLGVTTTVTTSVNHNFVIGNEVKVLIPSSFGCIQLNGKKGYVLSIPSANQVITSIDSSMNVDPFKTSNANTQPQIKAVGDINSGQINNNGNITSTTFIPGSFINISPL
jgi:hypothetical protein